MPVSEGLLKILACPTCKGSIRPTEGGEGLICPSCRVVFPVRDGIPVMLAEEAVPQEDGARED